MRSITVLSVEREDKRDRYKERIRERKRGEERVTGTKDFSNNQVNRRDITNRARYKFIFSCITDLSAKLCFLLHNPCEFAP